MPIVIGKYGSGARIPVKAARVLLGMKGHRPSAFNRAVGKCMKAKGIGPTNGGMHDAKFQLEFVRCAKEAGANISDEKMAALERKAG